MSWTDLFKSRSSVGKPDPRVRWFGKLPTYPDYYRSHTDEQWAVEFNSWVLKGFELYRNRIAQSPHRHARLPIAGCVVRLPKAQMTVLAVVLDFGGDMRGRPFPLFFYVGLPSAVLPGPTSDRITPIVDVLGRLSRLRLEVVRYMNMPGSFEAVFGDREIDIADIAEGRTDDSWIVAGKATPLADWFRGAQSRLKVKQWDGWLQHADKLGNDISEHCRKDFEPTLQFPLSAGVPLDVQCAGWLRWLELRMELHQRQLSLVMTGDLEAEAGQLSFVARELTAEDFLLLTPLASELSFVDSLSAWEDAPPPTKESSENSSASPADQHVHEQIAIPIPEDSRSWWDFVQASRPAT
ncbi:MAG: hypothetical protein ACE5E5_11240 [Phycisphaerae bacterium]